LNAEESSNTCVGQNSTQKPHALQRSTTIETRPLAATGTPFRKYPVLRLEWNYPLAYRRKV